MSNYLKTIDWGIPREDILATGDEVYFRSVAPPYTEIRNVGPEAAIMYGCTAARRPAAVYVTRSFEQASGLQIARRVTQPTMVKQIESRPVALQSHVIWSGNLQVHKSHAELNTVWSQMRVFAAQQAGNLATDQFLFEAVDELFIISGLARIVEPGPASSPDADVGFEASHNAIIIPFPRCHGRPPVAG